MSAIRRASSGVASLAASSSHPSHSHKTEKRPETGLWRGSSIVSLRTSDIGCEKFGLRNLSKVSRLWCGLFEQLPHLVGATAALQMAHKYLLSLQLMGVQRRRSCYPPAGRPCRYT